MIAPSRCPTAIRLIAATHDHLKQHSKKNTVVTDADCKAYVKPESKKQEKTSARQNKGKAKQYGIIPRMDEITAHKLIALTSEFYRHNARSFSETRQHAWGGWEKVADTCNLILQEPQLSVLDMACGNLRFARFLENKLICSNSQNRSVDIYAIDNCQELASKNGMDHNPSFTNRKDNVQIHFQKLDILEELSRKKLSENVSAPECNMTVCFGFMHHVPIAAWRTQLLNSLIDHTAQGGHIAVSFWQFLKNEKLRKKAEKATAQGCAAYNITFTDTNDRLLSWQDSTSTFRYCHNFDDAEIDQLLQDVSPQAELISRFIADNLNTYIVLNRR